MNVKQLYYIIALEEEGSTRNAAKKLGISQSTLSKYLLVLEESLGVSLFARTQKKLTPTAYGRVYIDAARQILDVYNATNQTIASMSNEKKVDFYFGIPPYRDMDLFVRLLPELQKKFPNITVHITEGCADVLIKQTADGALNLAVLNVVDDNSGCVDFIPLCSEEIILAVPAMNPLAFEASDRESLSVMDINRLFNCPLILPHESTAVRTIVDSLFAAKRLSLNIVCEANNSSALLNMVKQGVGCAFIPKSYMDDDNRAVYFCLKQKYFIKKIMVFQKGKTLSPFEKWMINEFLEHYKTDKEFRFAAPAHPAADLSS
ncbi:LysR family transcriptional regulator [Clostridium sp. MCC353]|uniref:LysR family transcriptional regulator n=1 Tax=Clostridium sp. MCC353 TaxID=2592646 RepID=UPI001C017D5D|nr:LysR family transcriptional regulator [Clostridium sp. MCC353]MBT9777936.1 LysR family transcriptional regulator [Clostridium sp. MCC353]